MGEYQLEQSERAVSKGGTLVSLEWVVGLIGNSVCWGCVGVRLEGGNPVSFGKGVGDGNV